MQPSRWDLSVYRLERAQEDLRAARINLESNLYKAAVNRSYYSIFHAICSVNVLDDFDASKHSSVIAHFNQYQIDVDIELTKQLYKEVDYSIDKTIYEIPEDEEMPASKINRMLVNFLIKGKILALPKYQKDIYSDEEVFGKKFPESIKVLSSDDEDYFKTFDNGIGAGIVFKHPCFHYDDEKFKDWKIEICKGELITK